MRFALVSGLAAAIISAVQFGLGLALTATSAPGPAHLLYASADLLDGAKMLALAVLGATAATVTALPRWWATTWRAPASSTRCGCGGPPVTASRRCRPRGGFGLPESVDVTFGHLIDALDTEFCRLGAVG